MSGADQSVSQVVQRCNRTNALQPWQSHSAVRTAPIVYAMGLQKAGTTLMGAALAATLGGGYQHEAVYFCCLLPSVTCKLKDEHFFMESVDEYFCQCRHVLVRRDGKSNFVLKADDMLPCEG